MNKKSFLSLLPRFLTSILFFLPVLQSMNGQSNAPTIPSNNYPDEAQRAIGAMNVPIQFYGIVIDQDGKALSGVKVALSVLQPYFDPVYLMKNKNPHFERITALNGRFFLGDIQGKNVEIESVTKSGYEVEPNVKHVYGPVSGSIDSPMPFKMWRQDIKEPIISGKVSLQTVSDGRHYLINLTNGTLTQSDEQAGDLSVWVKLLHKIDSRNYAWACQFRVINGGLSEERDSSSPMYLAPSEGYTNIFGLTINETNKWERSSGTLRFYLRLKNGAEYGRFSIDLAAYHKMKGKMKIEYAINPRGSRILK